MIKASLSRPHEIFQVNRASVVSDLCCKPSLNMIFVEVYSSIHEWRYNERKQRYCEMLINFQTAMVCDFTYTCQSDKFENGKISHKHVFIHSLFMYRGMAKLFKKDMEKEKTFVKKAPIQAVGTHFRMCCVFCAFCHDSSSTVIPCVI